MLIQGLNNLSAAYAAMRGPSIQRQTSPAPVADYADKVSISAAAQAMASSAQSASQEREVQNRIEAIKAKPAVKRTAEDGEFLATNDKRYAALLEKIKATSQNGFDALSADEVDYMQKAGGFVNTMAELSPKEKALYDELVAQGNHEAASGLMLVGMSRIGMSGQQITLPDGTRFDPGSTEVTAGNIRNLFKYLFVDPSGNTSRQFDALAAYLDKRETADAATNKA